MNGVIISTIMQEGLSGSEQHPKKSLREVSAGFINKTRENFGNLHSSAKIASLVGGGSLAVGVVAKIFEGKATEAIIGGLIGVAVIGVFAVRTEIRDRRLEAQSVKIQARYLEQSANKKL